MCADGAAVTAPASRWDLTQQGRMTLRYAVGSTLCMTVAMGVAWPMSFLVPVLSLGFLAAPARLPFKAGVGLVLTIAAASVIGLTITYFLLPYPFVFLPFIGLVLFRLYHAKSGGTSPLVILWLLIAVLVLPMVGLTTPQISTFVAGGLVLGAAVTVLMVWLVWAMFPAPPPVAEPAVAAATPAPAPPSPTPRQRLHDALLSTAVVFPVLVVFYTLQWTGSMLILIFIAILSLTPGAAGNVKAGMALIMGNVLGGLVAVVFFELLVMVPVFPFMVLLTLLCGLVLGGQLFSGKKLGPLFGMAFSTVLLVIGSTTTAEDTAGAKVYTRVLQIIAAVVYVVVAFRILERVSARRKELS